MCQTIHADAQSDVETFLAWDTKLFKKDNEVILQDYYHSQLVTI